MTDPTDVPFQDDRTVPGESLYEGRRPEGGPGSTEQDPQERDLPADPLLPPAETETDLLAARVEGPEDQAGMTELWRATMALPHWWFVAVGDEGSESPAAASIEGQLMLMTFTNGERARHFAVQNGMIAPTEELRAIALPPTDVVGSADAYRGAGIAGLMFDPHLSGYFIPSEQLPVVWEAIHADADAPR
ncbi:hypothetical protein [Ornithinimicrobium cerasi]|uniref:SseB protein N-terminal domain-containing protein n=1 Tax=Ornithinimicrobium cerasi TaxID=2248773 RepID=A0A285VIN4_9MICO|nr:hypothetical protein [Ornithinimicrobium cerasi]SOC52411.1 hypothetical protein SAMN05421879_101533 [Ornithinimicrobium cerasi]